MSGKSKNNKKTGIKKLSFTLQHPLIITYIPVILGYGISLFPNNPKESKWNLAENKRYKNGILQVTYSLT